jgi:threonine dehydratase
MHSYWKHFNEIENKFKTLELRVNTPVKEFKYKENNIFIKDENLNLNGSFKDRGVSYQMARHIQLGHNHFALSSSGNSALSACYVSKYFDVELQLLLSNKMSSLKLGKIKEFSSSKIKIFLTDKPRSELIKFLNNNSDYTNLRGSTDGFAYQGFKTISHELIEQVPNIDAIFIPCSSGTSSWGIYQGFKELNVNVPIHICQTEKINSIAKHFNIDYSTQKSSLADAITDRIAHRKSNIIEMVKETQGYGWVISDNQLETDKATLNTLTREDYSFNSVLAFSGWRKALEKGYNYKNPVLLFSGL